MRLSLLAGAVLALIVGGCGKGALGPPVEGVVTLDGNPLGNANVLLIPQGQSMGQSGFAKTDSAGKFRIKSANGTRDGAPPGEYKVVINKRVKPDGSDYVPAPDEDPMLGNYKELLPAAYSDQGQTQLKAEVSADGAKTLEFKLNSKQK